MYHFFVFLKTLKYGTFCPDQCSSCEWIKDKNASKLLEIFQLADDDPLPP